LYPTVVAGVELRCMCSGGCVNCAGMYVADVRRSMRFGLVGVFTGATAEGVTVAVAVAVAGGKGCAA
jgi:hypothetical protein